MAESIIKKPEVDEESPLDLTDSEKDALSRRLRRIYKAYLIYKETDSLDNTRFNFGQYCQIFYGMPPKMAEVWFNTGEIG